MSVSWSVSWSERCSDLGFLLPLNPLGIMSKSVALLEGFIHFEGVNSGLGRGLEYVSGLKRINTGTSFILYVC